MDEMQTDGGSSRVTTRLRQIFLIAFATIAFLMTAYATSGGLRIFLTEPYAWIGITALSVGFLAFTSLVLGDGISSNKITQIVVVTPFYLVAIAICWILSFTSYHQQFLSVGKSDLANSETNLRQMGIYAHDVTKATNALLEEKRTLLIKSEVFTDYSTAIIGLADELKDRDKKKETSAQLQAMVDAKKAELIDRQAKLEADEKKLRNDLVRLATNIGKLEKQSSDNQSALKDAQSLVAKVELALQLEEGDPNIPPSERPFLERESLAGEVVDAPACNRRRAAGKGEITPGPCYAALTEKLAQTLQLVDERRRAFDNSLENLKNARQSQVKEQNDLKKLLAQFEIDKLKSSEEFVSDFAADSEGFIESVNAYLDQPSDVTFDVAARYCQNVTEVLSDLNTSSELPACAPQALTAVFKQFNSLDDIHKEVGLACEEADRRELIIGDLRRDISGLSGPERIVPITRSYDKMRTEFLETCFVTAEKHGVDTVPIREDLTSLYDQINPSQDPISKAIGKAASLFDGTASARDYFPALLALLQELSLLLSKLFWDANSAKKTHRQRHDEDYSDLDLEAKPDEPVAVLAAKNILLNTTFHKQKHLLPEIFDEEYSHQMRSHMRRIIDNLLRKKLASKSARGILISEDGMGEIARQINRHNQAIQLANAEPEPDSPAIATAGVADVEKAPDPAQQSKSTSDSRAADSHAADNPADDNLEADKDELPDAQSQDSDLPQEAIVKGVPEIALVEKEETTKESVEQKPRKRRPIVVRPSFRREV